MEIRLDQGFIMYYVKYNNFFVKFCRKFKFNGLNKYRVSLYLNFMGCGENLFFVFLVEFILSR